MKPTKEQLSQITFQPLVDSLVLEDISDAEYFSDKFKDYVSNSRLKHIDPTDDGSPEKFFKGTPKLFTESLVFGSAVHELVLQPDAFFLADEVVLPPGKPGLIAEFCYNREGIMPSDTAIYDYCKLVDFWGGKPSKNNLDKLKEQIKNYMKERAKFEKEYYSTHIGGGFPEPIYLNPINLERIHGCLDSLNNNAKVQKLLNPVNLMDEPLPTGNEKTILMDVKATVGEKEVILHLKSKLDNYSLDEETQTVTVNDVKTTSALDYFGPSVKKYRYYREMGMYTWLLSKCSRKFFNFSTPTVKSNFLVVETKAPYASKVVKATAPMIEAGMREFVYLLRLVAWYSVNGYE